MRFSGTTKQEFCERLGDDWRALADVLEIPGDRQEAIDRQHPRQQGRGVWNWLEGRKLLGKLPDALAFVRRNDLRDLLVPEVTVPSVALAGWPGSPFPGLAWFRPADAPVFFGRKAEADRLLARFRTDGHRFIAVVGASGSGKSSLVAAGLIPRLAELDGGTPWSWHRLTPAEAPGNGVAQGQDPFLALAVALKPELEPVGYDLARIHQHLRSRPNLTPLLEAAGLGRSGSELLLFIDQFEELFTQVNPADRLPFAILLRQMAETPGLQTVITMRADFYPHCLALPPLTELLRRYAFPLGPPDPAALMEMIAGPAAVAGLTFEEGLPATLLRDTGTEPGALALMAFALAALYEACQGSKLLTHAAYAAFGGVKGAIGRKAEEAFALLPADCQNAFGTVFKELVDVDLERGAPTRKRALRSRFGGSPTAERLIALFQEHRLLVGDERDRAAAVVDVAHEALLSHWPRLRDWIAARLDDLRQLRQLDLEVREWSRRGKPEQNLWNHERLQGIAAAIARLDPELSADAREFLRPEAERRIEKIAKLETSPEDRAAHGERLAAIGDPRPGIGLTAAGLPDFVWLPVPAGHVVLEGERERKARTFTVAAFEIAQYPVTWRQYRAFLEAADGFRNLQWWEGLAKRHEEPGERWRALDNHPTVNVSWFDAMAFGRWLSERLGAEIRLPTEWEWQLAATAGHPDYEYPWGREWQPNHANTHESGIMRTTAVGMFPQGASPVGALDMSGNVWEWCLNEYEQIETIAPSGSNARVLRGGSWNARRGGARATFRSRLAPFARNDGIGVRLVRLSPIFK